MDFVFYFFYGLFRRSDNDSAFLAVLATFILIALYLLAAVKLLVIFGVLTAFPRFSDTYLYNKLYWYIPGSVVLGAICLYFNRNKRRAIIDKYDALEGFYSFAAVMLFLLLIALPIVVLVLV